MHAGSRMDVPCEQHREGGRMVAGQGREARIWWSSQRAASSGAFQQRLLPPVCLTLHVVCFLRPARKGGEGGQEGVVSVVRA